MDDKCRSEIKFAVVLFTCDVHCVHCLLQVIYWSYMIKMIWHLLMTLARKYISAYSQYHIPPVVTMFQVTGQGSSREWRRSSWNDWEEWMEKEGEWWWTRFNIWVYM